VTPREVMDYKLVFGLKQQYCTLQYGSGQGVNTYTFHLDLHYQISTCII